MPLPADAGRGGGGRRSTRRRSPRCRRGSRRRRRKAATPTQAGRRACSRSRTCPGIVVDDAQAEEGRRVEGLDVTPAPTSAPATSTTRTPARARRRSPSSPELPATGKYEVRLAYSPAPAGPTNVPVTVFSADGEKTVTVDMKKPPPIDGRFVSLGAVPLREERPGLRASSRTRARTGHVIADAVVFIPAEQGDGRRRPARTPRQGRRRRRSRQLEAEAEEAAGEPARSGRWSMSVVEEAKIEDAQVHVRGSVHNLGEPAPRGFLQVATRRHAAGDADGPERPAASWPTGSPSTDNPLTARVYRQPRLALAVRRRASSARWTTSAPPARRRRTPSCSTTWRSRFVEDGWSVKKLVRAIVLSRTYRQSSAADRDGRRRDPENRLLGADEPPPAGGRVHPRHDARRQRQARPPTAAGRRSRRRLAADYGYKHTDTRRSVYLPVFRNALPELFEVFDFADPSVVDRAGGTPARSPRRRCS